MEEKAPIVIFAFNRPLHLRKTVESLLANPEARESDLYVYVDGARRDVEGEAQKVDQVRQCVSGIEGFRSVHPHFEEENRGLSASVIGGVTEVVGRHGRVIVVEDDLVVAPNFLSYMNRALERYEQEQQVFSVCGYTNRVERPVDYKADTYFCERSSSWGWGTWVDRWNSVDWELEDWKQHRLQRRAFNSWGGSDCFGMLEGWKLGKNHSWAIRFCYAEFCQRKVSLFPLVSMVRNEGFDGGGTNCKRYSRFRCDYDESGSTNFVFPEQVEVNPRLRRAAMRYHALWLRGWSKIMYILNK